MTDSADACRAIWYNKAKYQFAYTHIYEEEELSRESTVKDFLTVRNEVKNYHFYSERTRSSQ